MGPRDAKVNVVWEGEVFVLNSKFSFNDQEVTMKATFKLADEGKTMTMNNHITTAMGEFDQKMV